MPELLGTELGEIDAIVGAQPPNLSFEIGPLLRVASLFVDEAIPDVDIGYAGFLRACAIKFVEITHVACFDLVPRIAGSPTHTIGTPFVLSAAIMSSMR